MDHDDRLAEHAAAKERSRLLLNREAYLAEQAQLRLNEPRVVRDDAEPVSMSDEERETKFLLSYRGNDRGLLWRANNTRRELARQQASIERQEREVLHHQLQVNATTEVKKMITDECFKVAHGVGQQLGEVVERVEKKLTELDVDVRVASKRAELAELYAEIANVAPTQGSNELFYLDDDGVKQDRELHGPILRAVDYPIDEKIMGPIRTKHRSRWIAEQKAQRQRHG
ncbi:hypothetical protein [Bradyrhizobium japonicum]|uniref:hypothetical protein n=1 Tax=Bradyrhizobium japonicum TaxID=375 RepID=UPI00209D8CF6|nr:hypothetical protein [Bradyrhizobium japonicum]MCP1765155.1 hypothetical protein [Bradyrhizobium japonicum]MCP1787292.1 hypothetical protein [Bradyrhizobium japonicum]MCP1809169.1 hypothetical protein [Bradyrhizobium japonicum]MCP1818102.1 hypothetical protein [Bradyrhizobium japonicum]MCP1870389.1 hypothetical protein [Bradyrhizobium japonicum]